MAFTNQWTAPNGVPVVTAALSFPDGVRSVAGVTRNNFSLADGQRYRNFVLVHADGASDYKGKTAADLDRYLARGAVLYYLNGNLGRDANGTPYPAGWWARTASAAPSADRQAFAWGTAQLAGNAVPAAQASTVVAPNAGPGPSVTTGPLVRPMPPPPPPPPPRRWPWVVGALALGAIAWVALD